MMRRGFTLTELLIAVAILAILAAITGPNLLEGQARAKVAHARMDMLMLIRAAEAYKLDNSGKYMPDNVTTQPGRYLPDMVSWNYLTTPIAYMTAIPQSPFREYKNKYGTPPYTGSDANFGNYYEYWAGSYTGSGYFLDAGASATGIYWRGSSLGPDNISSFHSGIYSFTPQDISNRVPAFVNILYDPSNGTLSRGDMFFCNKGILN